MWALGAKLLTGASIAGTAAAVPGIVDAVDDLGQWGNKKRKEINRMNDAEFEDYRPGLFDRTVLGIDPTKIEGNRDAYIQKNAEKDGSYISNRQLVQQNGGEWIYTPGQTASQAIAANSNAIARANTKQKISDVVTASDATFGTKKDQYERERQRNIDNLANRRFDYTMKTNAQERLDPRADTAQARADNIRMQIRADERSDKRYNRNLAERDRRDRRAAIGDAASGLVALAAAFAM